MSLLADTSIIGDWVWHGVVPRPQPDQDIPTSRLGFGHPGPKSKSMDYTKYSMLNVRGVASTDQGPKGMLTAVPHAAYSVILLLRKMV